jgi:large subunit ribosomal protein L17
MRHRISGRKFNRRTSQRKALFSSLAKSLLKCEQIVTTLPKAKDLRPIVEKMITLGKTSSVANRRNLFAKLRDNNLVTKVFGTLAKRYSNRNGGYTRIVKCGFRKGDMAPIAVIELIDRDESAKISASGSKDKDIAVVQPNAEEVAAVPSV